MEWYDQDGLLSLVWGCQHILILALNFFQCSVHHMVLISCKASYARLERGCKDSKVTVNFNHDLRVIPRQKQLIVMS